MDSPASIAVKALMEQRQAALAGIGAAERHPCTRWALQDEIRRIDAQVEKILAIPATKEGA